MNGLAQPSVPVISDILTGRVIVGQSWSGKKVNGKGNVTANVNALFRTPNAKLMNSD